MRIKHFFAAVLLAIVPAFAFAGIFADLNSMVMSNTTAAGTMTTKDRVGVFMGGFSMRTPISAVNLITFDPPRIDAGCGGIDLFGGSFSFVNGQQLITIFREVAADAAGLAFKAAIKAISPSLDALITEFQTLLQNLNNLAKNSCQMAHMIVDPAQAALSDAVNGSGTVSSTNSGLFSDDFSTLTSYLSNANSYLKNVSANNPTAGNGLAKTVVASGATSIMGLAGLSNVDGSSDDATNPNSLNNEILYGLLGYHIDAVPCSDQNAAGTAATTSTPSGNTLGQVTCSGPATITLDDIVKGGGTGSIESTTPLSLYACVNPDGSITGGVDDQICTSMKVISFNYQGIEGWVNTMLFGNADPASGTTSSSIVGEVNSTATTTFTTAQIQFMQQSGVPLAALLTKTSNPNTRISIAERLAPHIVDCVASRIGEVLYKGANLIQTSTGYNLQQEQKDKIKQLRTDFMAKQYSCNNSDVLFRIVSEINADTQFMTTNTR